MLRHLWPQRKTEDVSAKEFIHSLRSVLAEIAFSYKEGNLKKDDVIKLAEYAYRALVEWDDSHQKQEDNTRILLNKALYMLLQHETPDGESWDDIVDEIKSASQ